MSIGETLDGGPRERRDCPSTRSPRPPASAAPWCRRIEDDDFSPCGGDFYARGHIRTIAATVGARPDAAAGGVRRRPRARGGGRRGPPRSSSPRRAPGPSGAAPTGAPRWSPRSCSCVGFGVAQAVSGQRRRRADRRRRRSTATATGPAQRQPAGRVHAVRLARDRSAVAQAPRDRGHRGAARPRAQLGAGDHRERQGAVPGAPAARPGQDLHRPPADQAGGRQRRRGHADRQRHRRRALRASRGQVARVQFTPQDPAAG